MEQDFIVVETPIGIVALKIVGRKTNGDYVVELGDGSLRELVAEEVETGDDGQLYALQW